jgi:cysteinyl-tRNA synthetase
VRPRATEHIADQLELIADLVAKGYAYETGMGVYFDISKFQKYGALSGNSLLNVKDASRDLISDPQKRNPQDFALWKKSENHAMRWHSPYGWGFPGWHIECSAMAMRYLGKSFDIHSGGEDNKFPHHECEIAQSEASTGEVYAKYWVHTAHLLVNGRKMSKSSDNFLTVKDILDRGVDPLALRYALTCARYRDQLNFTDDALNSAIRVRERIKNCHLEVNNRIEKSDGEFEGEIPDFLLEVWEGCLASMVDDINTPEAYSFLMNGIRLINSRLAALDVRQLKGCASWFDKINDLTGLVYLGAGEKAAPASKDEWIHTRVQARNVAKAERNFDLADSIRAELRNAGIELVDKPGGTEWRNLGGSATS